MTILQGARRMRWEIGDLTSKTIKAILAGHMHYDYASQVTPTLKQYVVNTESCNIVTVR